MSDPQGGRVVRTLDHFISLHADDYIEKEYLAMKEIANRAITLEVENKRLREENEKLKSKVPALRTYSQQLRGEPPTPYEEVREDNKRLREAGDTLRMLLAEWRTTQFFDEPAQWKRWVDEFGPRVDDAISSWQALQEPKT